MRCRMNYFAFFIGCYVGAVCGVTVHNHTNRDVCVRPYYVSISLSGASAGPAMQAGSIVRVPANTDVEIAKPPLLFGYNRELIVQTECTMLMDYIEQAVYQFCTTVSIGWNNGSVFYLAAKDSMITWYSASSWSFVQPILEAAEYVLQGEFLDLQQYYLQHAHAKERAKITVYDGISQEEKGFLERRSAVVRKAVGRLLGVAVGQKQVPRVAVCMSGGGMRAALCAYGLFQGLADSGLLDTVTYAAALSGSTWFLAHHLYAGLPIGQYKQELMETLTHWHVPSAPALAYNLWAKYLWCQHMGIVDLYGAYLAKAFLCALSSEMGCQYAKLSDLQERLEFGSWPLPLLTAVESTSDLAWYTFTPYEVACEKMGYAIPTWAFGRTFVCGESIDCPPELSLGFLMGVWGSALSGTLSQMLDVQKESLHPLLYDAFSDILVHTGLDDVQLAAIHARNPLYCTKRHPLADSQQLTFVDAGYAYNLPFPPLFCPGRDVDLIIVLDVSENVHTKPTEMIKALEDGKREGWPLPSINTSVLNKRAVSYWYDQKTDGGPAIIYVVPLRDDSYGACDPAKSFTTDYATTRFVYDERAAEQLAGLVRHLVIKNQHIFKKALQTVVSRKVVTENPTPTFSSAVPSET